MIDNSAINVGNTATKHLEILDSEKANSHFRFSDVESLINNPEEILKMVKRHEEYQVPRLNILQQYYKGRNVGIFSRKARSNPEKSDVRNPSGYARYITDFFVGYMLGIPANTEYSEEDINEELKEFNRINDVDTLNVNIATSLSKFGRAYEIQYRTNEDVDIIKQLDERNTFMVYDTTIERNNIAGIYYVGSDGEYDIELHTAEEIIYYVTSQKASKTITIRERKPHDYGEVDIIEHVNNDDRMGDYELVIPSIDSYDYSQSDLTNYMNDINESKLIITGAIDPSILQTDEKQVAADNRDSDILILPAPVDKDGKPTGTANVHRITREYDSQGTKEYMDRLENNILKFSFTPDFHGEFFANNTSGVAILYRLYHSSHIAKKKEQHFEKGLRKRYRIWANFKMEQEEMKEYNIRDLKITMHTNLPTTYEDEIAAHIGAGGKLSEKTKLEQLTFIPNVEEERKRIIEEELETRGLLDLDPDWKKMKEDRDKLLESLEEGDI